MNDIVKMINGIDWPTVIATAKQYMPIIVGLLIGAMAKAMWAALVGALKWMMRTATGTWKRVGDWRYVRARLKANRQRAKVTADEKQQRSGYENRRRDRARQRDSQYAETRKHLEQRMLAVGRVSEWPEPLNVHVSNPSHERQHFQDALMLGIENRKKKEEAERARSRREAYERSRRQEKCRAGLQEIVKQRRRSVNRQRSHVLIGGYGAHIVTNGSNPTVNAAYSESPYDGPVLGITTENLGNGFLVCNPHLEPVHVTFEYDPEA